MKFYEMNEPNYSLVKAKNESDAQAIYFEWSLCHAKKVEEVERDYAIVMFCLSEDAIEEDLTYVDVLAQIQDNNARLLLFNDSKGA